MCFASLRDEHSIRRVCGETDGMVPDGLEKKHLNPIIISLDRVIQKSCCAARHVCLPSMPGGGGNGLARFVSVDNQPISLSRVCQRRSIPRILRPKNPSWKLPHPQQSKLLSPLPLATRRQTTSNDCRRVPPSGADTCRCKYLHFPPISESCRFSWLQKHLESALSPSTQTSAAP